MAVRPPDLAPTPPREGSDQSDPGAETPSRAGVAGTVVWLAATVWLAAVGLVVVTVLVVAAIPNVQLLAVTSGSMRPALSPGDVVVVVEPAESLVVGQLATFPDPARGGTLVTHRVVDHTDVDGQLAYLTQGDANRSPDPTPVPHSDLAGVVRVVLPALGRILPSGPAGPWPSVVVLFLTVVSVLGALPRARPAG